jgi:hypothetical protein
VIFIYKNTIPPKKVLAALQKKVGRGKSASTEIDAARKYYLQVPTPKSAYEFKRYKEHEVCVELNRLFSGKCAYCESPYNATDSRDIEHYRPKGQVTEEPAHVGYWWLAATWENLLISCPPCNQYRFQSLYWHGMTAVQMKKALSDEPQDHRGKGCRFPLVDPSKRAFNEHQNISAEEALLINPSDTNPNKYLCWIFDWDKTQPVWEADVLTVHVSAAVKNGTEDIRGRTSIEIFGLDRLELFRARMTQLKHVQSAMLSYMETLEDLAYETDLIRASKLTKRLARHRQKLKSFCRKEAAYAGVARAFVRLAVKELRQRAIAP